MIQKKNNNLLYVFLIILHAFLGILANYEKKITLLYGVLIFIVGLGYVLYKKNKNNEVLYAAAYLVGAEVFLRMTEGVVLYEFVKYAVILLMFVGILFNGVTRWSIFYVFFMFLLIPGILIGAETLGLEINVKNAILFNISGSLCLGFCSIYCLNKKITLEEIHNILMLIGFPIVSTLFYIIFFSLNIDFSTVINSTGSNFTTSGGYGPNQVSTILGLGMFVFFVRILFFSTNKLVLILNLALFFILSYRAFITFSRGGVLCGIFVIITLIIILFKRANVVLKTKIVAYLSVLIMLFSFVWIYSVSQTNGLLENRYENKDALGRVKKSKFTGREKLADIELGFFLDHPIWGIGVGKVKEQRADEFGIDLASHSEITRLLAEHGIFGILAIIILIFVPIYMYIPNKNHLYLLPFIFFWFFTINHAAMRIAAPAFMYGLSLLFVVKEKYNT